MLQEQRRRRFGLKTSTEIDRPHSHAAKTCILQTPLFFAPPSHRWAGVRIAGASFLPPLTPVGRNTGRADAASPGPLFLPPFTPVGSVRITGTPFLPRITLAGRSPNHRAI